MRVLPLGMVSNARRSIPVARSRTNLSQRDYHSVLRDIAEPSFAINPDYITQIVALRDGRTLTGTVRTEGDRLHVADTDGKVTTVRRDEVEVMTPAPTSIMPEGRGRPGSAVRC
jgi:putative heme-binding domain-containing protein